MRPPGSFDRTAAQIRKEWEAKGRPDCDHTRVARDTDMGADSGDRMCRDCGLTWYGKRPEPWRRDAS